MSSAGFSCCLLLQCTSRLDIFHPQHGLGGGLIFLDLTGPVLRLEYPFLDLAERRRIEQLDPRPVQ
jgi:hypothetical protein